MRSKARKVMIVGSEMSADLATRLVGDGWAVVWVFDGKAAISKARRELFDTVVLISTGKEMDVTETMFNLEDIRKSMTIVVVNQTSDDENQPPEGAFLSPNPRVIAVRGLDGLVKLLKGTGEAERSMSLH